MKCTCCCNADRNNYLLVGLLAVVVACSLTHLKNIVYRLRGSIRIFFLHHK